MLTEFELQLEKAAIRLKAAEDALLPANAPTSDLSVMAHPDPGMGEYLVAKRGYEDLLRQIPMPNCFGCPAPLPSMVIEWCKIQRELEVK